MRVSPDGKTMYLADTGIFTIIPPRLIVFDLESHAPRTALSQHQSVRPQRIHIRTADGPYKLAFGALSFRVGIDGIAMSHDGEWLYYAAISHDGLFRVPRELLDDESLSERGLAHHVERVATKPLNDGIDIDAEDTIYLTDVENGGIASIDSSGRLQTLVKSPDVVWADGVKVTSDGWVIFTDSAIPDFIDQLGRPPKKQDLDSAGPYQIYRFRAP